MPTLSPQAQAVVSGFGTELGVTQDQANNLQAVINASPALIDQINDAVAQDHLRKIVPLANPNAGGEYGGQNREMRLPLSQLTTPPSGQTFNAGEMTFVLGHELQHGFNHATTTQAYRDFMKDATQAAKTDHDYTDEIGKLLSINRRDEANAEIAGWNAVASMVKAAKSNSTLADIYEAQPSRLKDFVDRGGTYPNHTYTLKPNLTLNQDLTMSQTPGNVEAMGQNYFDKQAKALGGGVGLGYRGNSDYVNYYGAWPIGEAAKLERQHNPQPSMAVDLSKLGLTEQLLEENGINLGNNPQPVPYLDTSMNPPKAGLFQHTATSHQHTSPVSAQAFEAESARIERQPQQHDHQHIPVRPESQQVPALPGNAADAPRADEPQTLRLQPFTSSDHPQHDLYARLKAELPEYTSEARLAQFTAACHTAGIKAGELSSIDANSQRAVFEPRWGWTQAIVDMTQPSPPIQESLQRAEDFDRQMQEQERQQQAQRNPEQMRAGPAVSLGQ